LVKERMIAGGRGWHCGEDRDREELSDRRGELSRGVGREEAVEMRRGRWDNGLFMGEKKAQPLKFWRLGD
jgi:hypothetical protein